MGEETNMKIGKTLICFLFIALIVSETFADVSKNDEINVFLQEFKNGEQTGNFVHLDLFLLKQWDGKKLVYFNQEWFDADSAGKNTVVSMKQESTDFGTSHYVENLKWVPRELVECDYYAWGGNFVHLIAKKDKTGGKYFWNVSGNGTFKINDSAEPVDWLLKSVKEFKLEFPLIKLEPIYYDADVQ